MNRVYKVLYQNRGEMIEDLVNTFELIMLLIICRLNKSIYIKIIERDEVCE